MNGIKRQSNCDCIIHRSRGVGQVFLCPLQTLGRAEGQKAGAGLLTA